MKLQRETCSLGHPMGVGRPSVRIVILISVVSILGCSTMQGCKSTGRNASKVEARIVNAIAKCKNQTPCLVRVSDETPFAWDKMYAFKYTAGRGTVEKAIGTKVDRVTELQRRLVFTKDSRVVFYEEETTDVERPVEGEVAFDIPDTSEYKVYGPETVFRAVKVPFDSSFYYQLSQVR